MFNHDFNLAALVDAFENFKMIFLVTVDFGYFVFRVLTFLIAGSLNELPQILCHFSRFSNGLSIRTLNSSPLTFSDFLLLSIESLWYSELCNSGLLSPYCWIIVECFGQFVKIDLCKKSIFGFLNRRGYSLNLLR